MGRELRYVPPGSLVEVTTRVIQGRYLLAPSREVDSIVVGILGRAQRRYGMEICFFVVLSNHYHLLVIARDAEQLAAFMAYVNGNLSKEIGRLRGWSGPMWARRYKPILVSDEPEAQVARIDYLLSQGCKENLVGSPRHWPGATATNAWLAGESPEGLWFDRTAEGKARRKARRRGEDVHPLDFATRETVELSPIPAWRHLPGHRVRSLLAHRVRDLEQATEERHRAEGTRPLGRTKLLATDPMDRPDEPERSPAPRFHTATRAAFRKLLEAYHCFRAAFREAAQRMKKGLEAIFPPGSFPPRGPFVPHEPDPLAPDGPDPPDPAPT